ncbi:hypothetical protein [Cognatitamlana onchidii]|uniref:hypothetical protein n=1 Tax=Cognatitamlana onchidii TaxID=2562860 RepID=UPI0010A5E7DD|nr:hypothetical protein [Algibacter onchidii]
MKRVFKIFGALILSVVIFSCSPVKVVNVWNSNKPINVQNKNVLVVTKVDDHVQRVQFETDLVQHLKLADAKASESFKMLSNKELSQKLEGEALKTVKEKLRSEDVELVVLTALKSVEEYVQTNTSSGTNVHMYGHPWYYRGYGFYGYYNSFYINSTPISSVTSTNKKYILETVTYDLTLPDEEQLVSVITTQVDNPETLGAMSKEFSKNISKIIVG